MSAPLRFARSRPPAPPPARRSAIVARTGANVSYAPESAAIDGRAYRTCPARVQHPTTSSSKARRASSVCRARDVGGAPQARPASAFRNDEISQLPSLLARRCEPQHDASGAEENAADVAHRVDLAVGILTHPEHGQGGRHVSIAGRRTDAQAERGDGVGEPVELLDGEQLLLGGVPLREVQEPPEVMGTGREVEYPPRILRRRTGPGAEGSGCRGTRIRR